MNLFVKIYENVKTFICLFVLNSHNLYDASIYTIQNKKLKRLMKRAYEIPIYRKKFEESGLRPEDIKTREDLAKFPLLTKQELKEWITPQVSELSNKYYIVSTSGSTGTPLKTVISAGENAYLTANWLRIAMKNGINPFFQKTMALKDAKIVAAGRDSIIQKMGLLRRVKLPFTEPGNELVSKFNKYRPDFFYAHRSKMVQMVECARKEHLELHHPVAYAVISEMMSGKDEKLLREYFGDGIFTSYGCMETGACTFTPKGELTKHVITNDTHIINVIDEGGNLSCKGKMILTNLNVLKFPIINYDIGDDAEIFVEKGVEFIRKVSGRANDWVVLKDGTHYNFQPFYSVFEGLDKVLHFQIVQETEERILIRMVGIPELKSSERRQIEVEVLEQLDRYIPNSGVNYHFEWCKEIVSNKTGKTRFIVNKMKS